MSENVHLMREIAKLSGSINNHKRQQAMGGAPQQYPPFSRGRGRGGGGSRGSSRGYRGGYRGAHRGAYRGGRGNYVANYANTTYTRPPVKLNLPCSDFTSTGTETNCQRFTNVGKCVHGLSCRYKHDPHRVALCKTILHGQQCKNPTCTMNHDMNEFNAPLCTHFAKGHCTRDDCRFTHQSRLNGQQICPIFSLEGWCDNGSNCSKMHVFECPEFASTGKCTRTKCNLQHTLRAQQPSHGEATQLPPQPGNDLINVELLLQELGSDSDSESESESEENASEPENEENQDGDAQNLSAPSSPLDPNDFQNVDRGGALEDGAAFIEI